MPSEPLLTVRALSKTFRLARRPAITGIHFSLDRGRTLGLVGPSGSGKSTLAQCLAMFEEPDSGEILFEGRNLVGLNRREKARVRPAIQIVLQQPAAALNPRFTAGEIVAEPLLIGRRATPAACRSRAAEAMEMAGLPPAAAARLALSFSGGERQRLAIARALVLEPKLLILDESFSGLDLSVRAQILNLLAEAQHRFGTAYILISHDLRLVARCAGEIAVMDGGTFVEHAAAAELMAHPRHSLTIEMLHAAGKLSLAAVPDGTAA
jgi:ABC-type glutathione transport system ATPase component